VSTVWITISLTDLPDFLVGAQINAVNSAALNAGQSARFTNVMTSVVNAMRRKIEQHNVLSATALSLPPSLKEHACMFTIEALQGSIPGLKLDTDQVRRLTRLHGELEKIEDGDSRVETPADPLVPATVGSQSPAITERTRYFSRTQQDGL
jgi:hypothetical protein